MINYVQLIVGDVTKDELDLSQEFQISLQYSIADIRDISKRNSSFSKTIILPGTKKNNTVLGNLYDPNSDFTYFNPNIKTPCSLFVNSEVVMKGFLQLRNIKKLNNVDQEGNLIYWEVVIFNRAVDLMTELGEKTMNQIDLLELTHDYTRDNIVKSWTSSWTDGWVYPMYGFEQQPSTYKVEDFYPGYYSKYLLTSMLEDAGFGWTGSLATNAQFEKEIIPFVGSGSQSIGFETINSKNFRAGITQSYTIGWTFSAHLSGPKLATLTLDNNSWSPNVIPLLPGGLFGDFKWLLPADNFTYSLNPSETLFDNGNEWNVVTSEWTTTRKRKWAPIWRVNYDFTITNTSPTRPMWCFANDLATINGNPISIQESKAWNYPYIDFIHTLEYEEVIGLGGVTFSQWFPWDSFTVTRKIPTGGPGPTASTNPSFRQGQWNPGASFSVNVNATRLSNDLVLRRGQKVRIKIRAVTSTNLPEDEFTFILTQTGTGATYSHWQTTQGPLSFSWRNPQNGSVYSSLTEMQNVHRMRVEFTPRINPQNFLYNNGQPFACQEGDEIFARDFLSSKLKQKDFLADLIKRYNLYIQPSKDNDRQLIIDTREDFYNNNLQLDWTQKKDLLSEDRWSILAELQFKEALFTMKEDSDFHNADYSRQTGDIYGQYKWIFGNEFVKGINKIESPFSPTPLVKTPFGAITPALSTDDPKVNTRVLYWGGLKPTIGSASWVLQSSGLTAGSILTSTYSQYPYAGHFDDPYAPNLDIHFGTPAYLYYNNITTLPYNTMFETYWRDWINQIEDGRMLTSKFYLDEIDVRTISENFWAKIWIWDSWYWVNKIIDYQPLQGGLTEVELLKIRDGVRVAEEPLQRPSSVRNPMLIREPDPIGAIKIGMGNDIAPGGGIVIGDGNNSGGITIGSNDVIKINRNLVVGDSNVVRTYNGVVIGDTNTVNAPWGFVIGGQGANVTAPDVVVIANKEGRDFSESGTMYVGSGVEADTQSKPGLWDEWKRGTNIKVEGISLGQEEWKSIPAGKEIIISDKRVSRTEDLNVWGSLIVEGNTATQSYGNTAVWEVGKVEVENQLNLTGVLTVLGTVDIAASPERLLSLPQYAVIHATYSQAIGGVSTPQKVEMNYLRASRGFNLTNNRIYILNPATYKMTVTMLVENLNSQPRDVRFWLEFMGTPYPLSAHFFTAPARKSAGVASETIITFDFIGTSNNPGDWVELWWQGESTDLSLRYEPASGGIPESAAVTVNLMRV